MSRTTPGYRAILIGEATFERLKRCWRDGDDRDANALARLATVLLDALLDAAEDDPALLASARLSAKRLHVHERTRELAAVSGAQHPDA